MNELYRTEVSSIDPTYRLTDASDDEEDDEPMLVPCLHVRSVNHARSDLSGSLLSMLPGRQRIDHLEVMA